MTKLAAYQLRRAQQAGFSTVAEWKAHNEREHDRQRAMDDWRYRERSELRAAIAAGCQRRGNAFNQGASR